jgi:hypothetical protein
MKSSGKITTMKFDDAFEIVMNSARLPGTEQFSVEDDDLFVRSRFYHTLP